MKSNSILSKNEREIMELMWREGKPLSRSEVIELSPNRSWKSSSIHILLNQLLDKEVIKVDGFVKTGKNYGRTFSANLSSDQYQVQQFKQSAEYIHSKSSAITGFMSSLIENEDIDDETLSKLESILKTQRNKRK